MAIFLCLIQPGFDTGPTNGRIAILKASHIAILTRNPRVGAYKMVVVVDSEYSRVRSRKDEYWHKICSHFESRYPLSVFEAHQSDDGQQQQGFHLPILEKDDPAQCPFEQSPLLDQQSHGTHLHKCTLFTTFYAEIHYGQPATIVEATFVSVMFTMCHFQYTLVLERPSVRSNIS